MPTAEIVSRPVARAPLAQVIRDEERRHKRQVLTGLLAVLAVVGLAVAGYCGAAFRVSPYA